MRQIALLVFLCFLAFGCKEERVCMNFENRCQNGGTFICETNECDCSFPYSGLGCEVYYYAQFEGDYSAKYESVTNGNQLKLDIFQVSLYSSSESENKMEFSRNASLLSVTDEKEVRLVISWKSETEFDISWHDTQSGSGRIINDTIYADWEDVYYQSDGQEFQRTNSFVAARK